MKDINKRSVKFAGTIKDDPKSFNPLPYQKLEDTAKMLREAITDLEYKIAKLRLKIQLARNNGNAEQADKAEAILDGLING